MKRIFSQHHIGLHFLLVIHCSLCVLLAAGCQSTPIKRLQAKNPLAKNSPKTPTKMVDVWNTFAQTVPDGKPMRGIAGRVHFYNDGPKKDAIKVDGDMTVFLFDGEEKDPAHAKPIKIFHFKAEALPSHYAHKKPLGHGYDFFLPVDEIDGEEKNLCVIARFDDRLEGSLILSPPVNTILKGTKKTPVPENALQEFLAVREEQKSTIIPKPSDPSLFDPNNISQVAFKTTVEKEKQFDVGGKQPDSATMMENGRERTVTTIALNDNMTRRLAQGAQEPVETTTVSKRNEAVVTEPIPSNSSGSTSASNAVAPVGWSTHSFKEMNSSMKPPKIEYLK